MLTGDVPACAGPKCRSLLSTSCANPPLTLAGTGALQQPAQVLCSCFAVWLHRAVLHSLGAHLTDRDSQSVSEHVWPLRLALPPGLAAAQAAAEAAVCICAHTRLRVVLLPCRGPAFAPAGIYGRVRIEAYNTAFIEGASSVPGRCVTYWPVSHLSARCEIRHRCLCRARLQLVAACPCDYLQLSTVQVLSCHARHVASLHRSTHLICRVW